MTATTPETESTPGAARPELDVLVIGAGFAGMYAVKLFRERGLAVHGLEAGDDVGGTWHWNRYPGARCDSESPYYSYSFDPELEQEWPLTERYPEQPVILSYLRHVADRYQLRPDFTFGTRVTGLTFDDAAGQWVAQTDRGQQYRARFVVTAVGCLSTANRPVIAGQDTFGGASYHTGNWPHEPVDFTGQRVGIIGTGSTGIQAVPVVARQAASLTVFQRTAQYSLPARNHPLEEDVVREIKATYRELRQRCKESSGGAPHLPGTLSALEVDDQERLRLYEQAWEKGGASLLRAFRDIMVNEAANDTAADFVRSKITATVRDPEVAAKLMPTTYPLGTKRIAMDSGYFETFNRDNVSLVDLRGEPITEITPAGIRTTAGDYPLDVIIYATGFDAMTGTLLRMNIEGSGGARLADKWADGPKTFLGLAVAGFPNLFTVTGPGSPSVLSNMPVSIEQHVEWIYRCVTRLVDEGVTRIEAVPEAEAAWTQHVDDVANGTLYPRANSWYMGANIEGKARGFMPYVGGLVNYRRVCDEVEAGGYRGFAIPGRPVDVDIELDASVSRYAPIGSGS